MLHCVKLFSVSVCLISYIHEPQTVTTQSLSITYKGFVSCPNLQFEAEQHSEENKTETEEADGQADQPSEHSSLPGWVIELLTARYWTASLDSLQREQSTREQAERVLKYHNVCLKDYSPDCILLY